MGGVVNCWHCEHYIWFSADKNNLSAVCRIKNHCVSAKEKVCE